MKTQIVIMSVLMMVMVMSSGCASYYSLRCSEDEIAQSRIFASGNKDAMEALRMGAAPVQAMKVIPVQGGAILALDITQWDAFWQHPWRQIGAGALDIGTGVGIWALGDKQGWWGNNSGDNSPSIQVNTTGNGNSTFVNTGSGNTDLGNPNYSEDNSSRP